jgi:multidrug efflux pump subunit AcrA (membrane-fusion protein)
VNRVLLLLLASSCAQGASAAPGEPIEMRVTRGDLSERVLLSGQLVAEQAERSIVPMTKVWQLSIRWLAEDGASAKPGDRVVEFDNSVFVGELAEKRLRLRQANLDLAAQRATAAATTADKEFALAREKILLEKAALEASLPREFQPERDWQEKQLARERAQVAVRKADAELGAQKKAAALELQVKEIEADKIRRELEVAEQGIAALTLTAPKAGILLVGEHPWEDRKFQVGDVVQPGWTVVELPDLSAMRVEASLSDVDDGRVASGARVTCTLDAWPDEPLPGTVREVAPLAQEVGQRSLRRAFKVVIALDHTDPERMRPGMSVKVEVRGKPVVGALTAPRAALDVAAPAAFLAGGERVPIELGPCDAQRCVVTKGLSEGQALGRGP